MNCGFNAILQIIFNDPDIMENVKEKAEKVKDEKEKILYTWLVDNLKVYKEGRSVDSQKFRELIALVNSVVSSESSEQIDVEEAMATFYEIFSNTNFFLKTEIFGKNNVVLGIKDDRVFFLPIPLNENEIISCLETFLKGGIEEVSFYEGNLKKRKVKNETKFKNNPKYLNLHLKRFKHITKFKTISNVKDYNRRVFIDGVEYVRPKKENVVGKNDKKSETYENYFISIFEEDRRKWFSNATDDLLKEYFPELQKYPKRYDIKDISGEERLFLNEKEIEKEIKVESGYDRKKAL